MYQFFSIYKLSSYNTVYSEYKYIKSISSTISITIVIILQLRSTYVIVAFIKLYVLREVNIQCQLSYSSRLYYLQLSYNTRLYSYYITIGQYVTINPYYIELLQLLFKGQQQSQLSFHLIIESSNSNLTTRQEIFLQFLPAIVCLFV